jgi:hypothetical protein
VDWDCVKVKTRVLCAAAVALLECLDCENDNDTPPPPGAAGLVDVPDPNGCSDICCCLRRLIAACRQLEYDICNDKEHAPTSVWAVHEAIRCVREHVRPNGTASTSEPNGTWNSCARKCWRRAVECHRDWVGCVKNVPRPAEQPL